MRRELGCVLVVVVVVVVVVVEGWWLPVLCRVPWPVLVKVPLVPELDASAVEDVREREADERAARFEDALMPDAPVSGERGDDLFFGREPDTSEEARLCRCGRCCCCCCCCCCCRPPLLRDEGGGESEGRRPCPAPELARYRVDVDAVVGPPPEIGSLISQGVSLEGAAS